MEQHQPQKQELLVKTLLPTDLEGEPEPYILTKDEEAEIFARELLSLKQHVTWKMKGLGYTDFQIIDKIAGMELDKNLDKDEILKRGNSNKHYWIWEQEQRTKEKESTRLAYQLLLEKCNAKYMYRLMKWSSQNIFGKQLIVNDNTLKLIQVLCYFLSNDERFETELNYSFKKGLLIRGISGLGKTHLVRCVEKNELHPILVLSMLEIADEVRSEGEYKIEMGTNKILYLDDVGTEEATVNFFGTKINFFKNFLELTYLRNQFKTFSGLMISTNNSFDEIEQKYGFRVRSRIKDMFNIIDVKGEDMRG